MIYVYSARGLNVESSFAYSQGKYLQIIPGHNNHLYTVVNQYFVYTLVSTTPFRNIRTVWLELKYRNILLSLNTQWYDIIFQDTALRAKRSTKSLSDELTLLSEYSLLSTRLLPVLSVRVFVGIVPASLGTLRQCCRRCGSSRTPGGACNPDNTATTKKHETKRNETKQNKTEHKTIGLLSLTINSRSPGGACSADNKKQNKTKVEQKL